MTTVCAGFGPPLGSHGAHWVLHLGPNVSGPTVSSSGGRLTVASAAASCYGVYNGVQLRRQLRRRGRDWPPAILQLSDVA
jgi:hypothetical protein